MFAALITGKDTVELREFPDPTPAPEGVVVDIAFCGICGTDVHAYQSGRPYNPAICGHEWSGTVSAVGSDVLVVHRGRPGRRRGRSGVRPLHRLPSRSGRPVRGDVPVGARSRPAGATAWWFRPTDRRVAAQRIVKTDPALTDAQAAQVEPTTVAFHAVRTSALRLGDIAVDPGRRPDRPRHDAVGSRRRCRSGDRGRTERAATERSRSNSVPTSLSRRVRRPTRRSASAPTASAPTSSTSASADRSQSNPPSISPGEVDRCA